MSISATEIHSLFEERRRNRGSLHREMDDVRRHYYGEITVPLPELDEYEKPAVANLFALGIDQMGMRIGSVTPAISSVALRPGFKGSEELALSRKLAVSGWWDMNAMKMKNRRRGRFLVAYACSPVSISPVSEDCSKRRIPFWRVRNPLCTYPSQMHDPDNIEPDNVIFHDQKPLSWLTKTYPERMHYLHKGSNPDGSFDVLEYADCDETVFVCLGTSKETNERRGFPGMNVNNDGITYAVELERIPNRAGICPVVVPGRVGLDRPQSQFSQMIGMYHRAAKLDVLQLIAVFRAIFPDEWIESVANSPSKPKLVREADGKQGIMGIIENGRYQQAVLNIPQSGFQALDSLERNQRLTGGIPAEFGGESPTNVRTARRGAMVLGAAMDMPIQEYQEILERSFEAEIRRAIKVMKTYFNGTSMFFIPADGIESRSDYDVTATFETDHVVAKYALPGYDAAQAEVAAGQKIGEGVWSAQKAMEMDASVDDVEFEINRIQMEGLRRSLLAGMEAQAQNGQLDPHTIARIAKAMADGKTTLEDAVDKVHRQMQDEQHAQAQAQGGQPQLGQGEGQPEQPKPEELQPGMQRPAALGPGAPPMLPPSSSGEEPGTTVPQPPMGAADLMKLLSTTHPAGASAA